MSKYLKPGMRLCILFVLVITAVLLSKPPKALANDCSNQCMLELHMCTPACNGDSTCLADCNAEFNQCVSFCF